MPEPHARVIGRYALYDAIASGGMATVHFGQLMGPVGFSRLVAIKRLLPQHAKNSEFVKMFLDEVRVAARIHHPNVVATLDVVSEPDELFLVLDYIQGETFARLLKLGSMRRPPTPAIVASIVTDMLYGLHAAHEAKDQLGNPLQIVHRDVSPQNVLVGVDGIARVLDFGIAKAKGRLHLSMVGQLKGKLSYMPPEQISGRFLDRRADIYAAAIVLWEALTGQRLFDGRNEAEIMEKITQGLVCPARDIVPGVPKALDDIALCGLAMDPSNRFQTAQEMARAIETEVTLASRSEISEWVESTASVALAQHTEMISSIERYAAEHASLAPRSSLPKPPVKSSSPGSIRVAPPKNVLSTPTVPMSAPSAQESNAPLEIPSTSQPFVTQKPAALLQASTNSEAEIAEGVASFRRTKLTAKFVTLGGVIALAGVTVGITLFNKSESRAQSHALTPGSPDEAASAMDDVTPDASEQPGNVNETDSRNDSSAASTPTDSSHSAAPQKLHRVKKH